MILLTILYDEYISIGQNWQNKKNPVEHIVPPQLKWVAAIILSPKKIICSKVRDFMSAMDLVI